MGFDLYGENPIVNKVYPSRYDEILKQYGKDGWLDWVKIYLKTLKMNTMN